MNTPICDFVKKYAESENLRLHMPGHKGINVLGVEQYDITEIDGADVLYQSEGIIKESEDNASSLFGTKRTVYSTEGSSLAIRAMLYLATVYAKEMGKSPKILAGRNAHKTFLSGVALLDIETEWLYPENYESVLSCEITPEHLENHIKEMDDKPTAIYITSPDYLGNITDIEGISAVCHKYGCLLLVDNAHGAYLNFLPTSMHPVVLGADMCCDSAHKTLPVLTGGAYLHISKNAPDFLSESAYTAMSIFASTSPSYLILQSLDMANKYISGDYKQNLADFVIIIDEFKKELKTAGYNLTEKEPLKITISTKPYGYEGTKIAKILKEKGIVCEFADPDYIVFMLTPKIGKSGVKKLKRTLLGLPKGEIIAKTTPKVVKSHKILSPRVAMLSPNEEIDINQCLGRVLASPSVSCPPAVPIVVCGEVIDESAIETFKYYGITKCHVVK